jgi:hypothetical protein
MKNFKFLWKKNSVWVSNFIILSLSLAEFSLSFQFKCFISPFSVSENILISSKFILKFNNKLINKGELYKKESNRVKKEKGMEKGTFFDFVQVI